MLFSSYHCVQQGAQAFVFLKLNVCVWITAVWTTAVWITAGQLLAAVRYAFVVCMY